LAARKGTRGEGPPALVGFFAESSGVAASAQRASRALEVLGIAHRRIDVGRLIAPNDPGDPSASAWVFYLNPPELLYLLFRWRAADLRGPRFGYWSWELPKAPPSWIRAMSAMDCVMVPSRYTANAFSPRPVTVTPHPIFIEDLQHLRNSHRRTSEDRFKVVSLFDFKSSFARKNPFGSLEAFQLAFAADENAQLVLKTQNADVAPGLARSLRERSGSNVQIIDEAWPYPKVLDLIASADALISLHRAEGFGLTLAEAMALGTPVVATDWSGNLDFMDQRSACLVSADNVEIDDPQHIYGGQMWAEPDVGVAAMHLRRLRAEPEFAHELASRARERAARQFSPEAWLQSLPAALRSVLCVSPPPAA
jgi:glycosyltransferase involved in cell wall biosynthesis